MAFRQFDYFPSYICTAFFLPNSRNSDGDAEHATIIRTCFGVTVLRWHRCSFNLFSITFLSNSHREAFSVETLRSIYYEASSLDHSLDISIKLATEPSNILTFSLLHIVMLCTATAVVIARKVGVQESWAFQAAFLLATNEYYSPAQWRSG